MKELVGTQIKIIEMVGEPKYSGKTGFVEHVDDLGQIHGTWGGLALIQNIDTYEIVEDEDNE
jgi:hypothetical protein